MKRMRLYAALLACLMVLSLAACSKTPAAPTAQETPAAAEPEAPSETTDKTPADSTEAPASTPADEPAEEVKYESTEAPKTPALAPDIPRGFAEKTIAYPICDDGEIVLEYWTDMMEPVVQKGADAVSDNYAWSRLRERTGVQVRLNIFIPANYATQYSLMLASEDYPDLGNTTGTSYPGGTDRAIDDGVYVDLTPYLETYAPNYLRMVNRTEATKKTVTTDAGNIPYFAQFYNRPQPSFLGFVVRQDWLRDLGMKVPETVEEWHDTLVRFRDEKTDGVEPMEWGSNGFSIFNFFEGAYNVSSSTDCGLIVKDGVVESSFLSDGMREYLETITQWYQEGLINREFVANNRSQQEARMANNQTGIKYAVYTQTGDYPAKIGQAEEDCYLELMPYPTVDGIERNVYWLDEWACGTRLGGIVLFAACDHLTEAIRTIDYFYSEEGYTLTNYGIEGVTFTYDENGIARPGDLIIHNPEGLATTAAQQLYLVHSGPVIFLLEREENTVNEEGLRYRELWSAKGKWNLPSSLSYTAEEGEVRSRVVADVTTYVQEFICRVIIGETQLNDDTWNAYINQLRSMGIDDVIAVGQDAYDRFLQR